MSAILNWGLQGYQRLEKQGWNFTRTSSIDEKRLYYKRKSEPVWAFAQDLIEERADCFIFKKEAYERFKQWCKDNGEAPMTDSLFYRTLIRHVNTRDSYRKDSDGRQKHAFEGIKFKELGQKDAILAETFTHLRPDELGFGANCEYCGRASIATFKSDTGRLACKECANSS